MESKKTGSDREDDAVGTVPREGLGPGEPGTESGITREADGGSSRIKDGKLLRAQWRQAKSTLNKLEKAAKNCPLTLP